MMYASFINSLNPSSIAFIEHPTFFFSGQRHTNFIRRMLRAIASPCQFILSSTRPASGFDFRLLNQSSVCISINGSISLELSERGFDSIIMSIHPLLFVDSIQYLSTSKKFSSISPENYKQIVSDFGFSYSTNQRVVDPKAFIPSLCLFLEHITA